MMSVHGLNQALVEERPSHAPPDLTDVCLAEVEGGAVVDAACVQRREHAAIVSVLLMKK